MSMTTTTKRWPRGTGQWNRTRVLIVAADPRRRDQLLEAWAEDHDVAVAQCPLEVIRRCENDGPVISTVVLSDLFGSVHKSDLAEFLSETYPYLRVIIDHPPRPSLEDADELFAVRA